jgi:hypothetical protein
LDYLERAYGTAKAYFEIPYDIYMTGGWAHEGWIDWAYKLGNFHEKYLLPLIDALETEQRQEQADELRLEWEKKVKYFLYDDPYPWVSEMPIDSTAYESTYAIAKYGLQNILEPDENLWQDKNTERWYSHPNIDERRHWDFLKRQRNANLACRGSLETSYYHYGSDFRGCGSTGYTMSYMSQMGGWSILDQAIQFEKDPYDDLRLGYGSLLCSWALVNSGPAEDDYGYWFKGAQHDGAVSWGFMPQQNGSEWNPATQDIPRGPWGVDGEIDHGLVAGIEAATSIIVNDPIFGWVGYGAKCHEEAEELHIHPRDGVRQSLHLINGEQRFCIQLDRDGFSKTQAIIVDKNLKQLQFHCEHRDESRSPITVQILSMGLKGLVKVQEHRIPNKASSKAFELSLT